MTLYFTYLLNTRYYLISGNFILFTHEEISFLHKISTYNNHINTIKSCHTKTNKLSWYGSFYLIYIFKTTHWLNSIYITILNLSYWKFHFTFVPSNYQTLFLTIYPCQSSSALGQALDRLVLVSSMCYHTSTSNLSTSWSTRGLTSLCYGISYLEGGFTLRCLQRLSLPNLATRLCTW